AKKVAAPQKAPPKAVKKTVARPVTRAVVKKAVAPVRAPEPKRERTPRVAPKPLPTAPVGEVPLIGADGSVAGSLALPASLGVKASPTVLFQAIIAAESNARQG